MAAKDAAAEIENRLYLGTTLSDVISNKEDAVALFDLFRNEGYILAENRGKYCVCEYFSLHSEPAFPLYFAFLDFCSGWVFANNNFSCETKSKNCTFLVFFFFLFILSGKPSFNISIYDQLLKQPGPELFFGMMIDAGCAEGKCITTRHAQVSVPCQLSVLAREKCRNHGNKTFDRLQREREAKDVS